MDCPEMAATEMRAAQITTMRIMDVRIYTSIVDNDPTSDVDSQGILEARMHYFVGRSCLLYRRVMDYQKELATFIRTGIQRRPMQAIGHYFQGRNASCALGAAYEGMYRLPADVGDVHPSKDLQWFFACLDAVRKCPAEGCAKKLSL